ncbi:hypothetical protein RchiOBHm_Chr1g0360091 [Rosa chinensis]|uniref:Uncharacterized protein n=1 Tax=Rosa chinensis TaxID=74649 RepID=A0A2P6SII8_ROSCH|nr:hypothetical protein RchiOBHm_Chr1g0360091 [Rosa chinensis]
MEIYRGCEPPIILSYTQLILFLFLATACNPCLTGRASDKAPFFFLTTKLNKKHKRKKGFSSRVYYLRNTLLFQF